MKKVLLIQLLRLGDVLMTLDLIRALREERPGVHVAMLGCSIYAGPLKELLPVDQLFLIDRPHLAKLLLDDDRPVERAYEEIAGLVGCIRGERFDLAINLSHCEISALLAYLSGAEETLGLVYDVKGARRINGPWARYLFSLVKARGLNALHMSDIYKRMAGVSASGRFRQLGFEAFGSRRGAAKKKRVGLQPGASIEAKRWPPKNFAVLADMLVERCAAEIVVFGSSRESGLAREVCESMSSGAAENLAGRTSLPDLVRELSRCDLLVTNDTGTMHLASAAGTRILAISLGPTRVLETGPTGHGDMIVEPAMPCMPCDDEKGCRGWPCRHVVSPEAVCSVARHLLGEGVEADTLEGGPLSGVYIYKSEVDASGEMVYAPIGETAYGLKGLLSLLYRKFWSNELGPARVEEDAAGCIAKYFGGPPPQSLGVDLERCREVFQSVGALFSLGSELTSSIARMRRLRALDPEWLVGVSLEIEDLDKTIIGFDRLAAPLASMYEIEILNTDREDFFEIADQRRRIYLKYAHYSARMARLAEEILSGKSPDSSLNPGANHPE